MLKPSASVALFFYSFFTLFYSFSGRGITVLSRSV